MLTKDLQQYGTALIVSGPSGAGKSTVCKKLLETEKDLHFSVSCTTRQPRRGEKDGVDYYFLTRDEFNQRVQGGQFLEFAEVHGEMYGTLREEVEKYVRKCRNVLLDIDVQGARQVKSRIVNSMLGYYTEYVFIGPPSYEELERRLRDRGTEDENIIQRRLENAVRELEAWNEYTYLVINDEVDDAVKQLQAILQASANTTTRVQQNPWPRKIDGGVYNP
ncbi:MAG: guanylate kinase [Lentisphaeria bacterium]